MSINEEVNLLRKIPLFAKIDPAKLKLLAFASERLTFAPDQALFEQGDTGDAAYIVIDGEADGMPNVRPQRVGAISLVFQRNDHSATGPRRLCAVQHEVEEGPVKQIAVADEVAHVSLDQSAGRRGITDQVVGAAGFDVLFDNIVWRIGAVRARHVPSHDRVE